MSQKVCFFLSDELTPSLLDSSSTENMYVSEKEHDRKLHAEWAKMRNVFQNKMGCQKWVHLFGFEKRTWLPAGIIAPFTHGCGTAGFIPLHVP